LANQQKVIKVVEKWEKKDDKNVEKVTVAALFLDPKSEIPQI
jgi:hypothetical protein